MEMGCAVERQGMKGGVSWGPIVCTTKSQRMHRFDQSRRGFKWCDLHRFNQSRRGFKWCDFGPYRLS